MKISIYQNPRAEFVTSFDAPAAPARGDTVLVKGIVAGEPDAKVGFTVSTVTFNVVLGSPEAEISVYADRWGVQR